jgi:hypothetical protein
METPDMEANEEIEEIFREIIKRRHRDGFFTMESHGDKILILGSSKLPKRNYMVKNVHRMYLRRRYWYTYVICEIINEFIPESEVAKKGKRLCSEWENKIGLRTYTADEEKKIIKKREFEKLSETTIDVIPHAILSKYVKWIDEPEIKKVFDDAILSIINGEYAIEDPANFFWALRMWMEENDSKTIENPKKVDPEQKLTEYLGKIIIPGNKKDSGYFESPKPPSWDSTPEIYHNIRTTLYILLNLTRIKKIVNKEELRRKIDNTIEILSKWINDQKKEIYQNPYFSVLLLKYKWEETVKKKTPEEIGGLRQNLKNFEEKFKKERIREIIKKVPKLIYYIIGLIAAIITIFIYSLQYS